MGRNGRAGGQKVWGKLIHQVGFGGQPCLARTLLAGAFLAPDVRPGKADPSFWPHQPSFLCFFSMIVGLLLPDSSWPPADLSKGRNNAVWHWRRLLNQSAGHTNAITAPEGAPGPAPEGCCTCPSSTNILEHDLHLVDLHLVELHLVDLHLLYKYSLSDTPEMLFRNQPTRFACLLYPIVHPTGSSHFPNKV